MRLAFEVRSFFARANTVSPVGVELISYVKRSIHLGISRSFISYFACNLHILLWSGCHLGNCGNLSRFGRNCKITSPPTYSQPDDIPTACNK